MNKNSIIINETTDEAGTKDIIKKGVLLEEEFVKIISYRINEVAESENIEEGDRKTIKTILDALVRDSKRHEELFKEIIKRY